MKKSNSPNNSRLLVAIIFLGVVPFGMVHSQDVCTSTVQGCVNIFVVILQGNHSNIDASIDAICGPRNGLMTCRTTLQAQCMDNSLATAGLEFLEYVCNSTGLRSFWTCEVSGCPDQPSPITDDFCSLAQKYVDCIRNGCDPDASTYIIRAQNILGLAFGKTCNIQETSAVDQGRNKAAMPNVFLPMLLLALAISGL